MLSDSILLLARDLCFCALLTASVRNMDDAGRKEALRLDVSLLVEQCAPAH